MKILTYENYEIETKNKDNIIKFYADWCAPCKRLSPKIEAMSNDFPNINFLEVNVDESPELVKKFGVRGIPHIVYIDKQGQIQDQIVDSNVNKILEIVNNIE